MENLIQKFNNVQEDLNNLNDEVRKLKILVSELVENIVELEKVLGNDEVKITE